MKNLSLLLCAMALLAGCDRRGIEVLESTTTAIGPSGGSAWSADGELELKIQPGALVREVTIVIRTDRETKTSGQHSLVYRLDATDALLSSTLLMPADQPVVIAELQMNEWRTIPSERLETERRQSAPLSGLRSSSFCTLAPPPAPPPPPPPPSCGDGTCENTVAENCTNCQADCGACPAMCGDGICNRPVDEDCGCPADCGECVCGDGICEYAEAAAGSCSMDCATHCGDGTCDSTIGETCDSCSQDCGACPSCGDGTCTSATGEDCATCAQDCGACLSCGDGTCTSATGEDCTTCTQDCGSCASCGDGTCASGAGETCATCWLDCGACAPACGDGLCTVDTSSAAESCTSCQIDCGACVGPIAGVESGMAHACLLTHLGEVWCMGANLLGEVGDGTQTAREWPTQVFQAGITLPQTLVAGFRHSCAIKNDATLWCWGAVFDAATPVLTAQQILRPGGQPLASVVDADGGSSITCAATSDGSAYCFGSNLGADAVPVLDGAGLPITDAAMIELSFSLMTGLIVKTDGTLYHLDLAGPTATPHATLSEPVLWAAAGDGFECAVRASDRRVGCWGVNDLGQLGDGTGIDQNVFSPVVHVWSPNNMLIMDGYGVNAGASHACAMLGSTQVACWGENDVAQLGSGMSTAAELGARVMRSPNQITFGMGGIVDVAAGGGFTCVVDDFLRMSCSGQMGGVTLGYQSLARFRASFPEAQQ